MANTDVDVDANGGVDANAAADVDVDANDGVDANATAELVANADAVDADAL